MEGKKQKDRDNKKPEATGESRDRRNNAFYHRKKKTGEREFREEQELSAAPEQEPKPEPEGPPSFNAHALDLEPGVIIPERPSLDLTYHDFTRESYEAGEKPFVPKRRKAVPFELSETPRMQSEYWEGRTPGRRKILSQAESAVSAETNDAPPRQQESRQPETRREGADRTNEKRESQQRAQKGRPERKAVRENPREDSPGQGNAGRQDKPGIKKNPKRQEHNIIRKKGKESKEGKTEHERGGAPAEPVNDQTGESAKESLMKPYWMKK